MPLSCDPQRAALGGYLSAFVAMGVCTMLLGPSLDTIATTTHTPTANIGVLFTASSIGYLLGVTASGQWITHRSVHRALIAGVAMMMAAVVLIPSATSLLAVFGCEILLGFGIGWIEIPANSAILWNHGGGRAINALHAAFAIGAVLAPVIVGRSLAWSHSLRGGYLVAGVIAMVPLLLLRGRRPPTNPHVDHGRGIPTGARALTAVGTLFFAFYVGVEITFAGWIYKYAQARGVATSTNATIFGAVFLGAFAVGRVIGVPIARRLAPHQVLYIDHAIAVAGIIVLMIAPRNLAALLAGTIIFGLGIASMFASMLGLSEMHVAATSTVTSIYLVGSSVGTMVLPWVTGRLLAAHGPGALPIVALISTSLTLLTVWAFRTLGEHAGQSAGTRPAGTRPAGTRPAGTRTTGTRTAGSRTAMGIDSAAVQNTYKH